MQSGYWIQNPPIGYRYQIEKPHGKLLFSVEPLASVIREGFEGYAMVRFQSQAEVKRFFEGFPEFPRNKAGIVTQQRVTDILRQPLYTGYICSENYGLSWLKGHHKALISVKTFEKVQARRDGVAKTPKRKNAGDDFALRGFVSCAGCGVPLRSSWSKDRSQTYACYLCQTKACDRYGKSIARDKVEDDVGALVKTLQPTQQLIGLTKAMFRNAWTQRVEQALDAIRSGHRQIKDVEKQIETLLSRIIDSTNATVISTYEDKITELERRKIILGEQLASQAEPNANYEEKLEPVFTFLANSWKIWKKGHVVPRRTVLKLAFEGWIQYDRNKVARTRKIAFPFKMLRGTSGQIVCCGAGGEH